MGQPVKISDLASKMIALTGFEPNKDISLLIKETFNWYESFIRK